MESRLKVNQDIKLIKKDIILHKRTLEAKYNQLRLLISKQTRPIFNKHNKPVIINKEREAVDDIFEVKRHIISDHALLRYLEREKGWDVSELKNDIVQQYALQGVVNSGATQYKRDGLVFIIGKGVVTTVTRG